MDIISIIHFIREQSRLTNLVPKTENFVYPLSFYIPPYEGNWCLNRFTKVTVQEVDEAEVCMFKYSDYTSLLHNAHD
jgi:hypothetical protein